MRHSLSPPRGERVGGEGPFNLLFPFRAGIDPDPDPDPDPRMLLSLDTVVHRVLPVNWLQILGCHQATPKDCPFYRVRFLRPAFDFLVELCCLKILKSIPPLFPRMALFSFTFPVRFPLLQTLSR